MFRRNPDFLAVIAIALYLALGNLAPLPAVVYPRASRVREEIHRLVKAELRAMLDGLALTVRQ